MHKSQMKKNVHRLFPIAPMDSTAPDYLLRTRGKVWGLDNDIGQVGTVLVRRPGEEITNLINPESCTYNEEYGAWVNNKGKGYWISPDGSLPDLLLMQSQHDTLVETLRQEGADIVYLNDDMQTLENYRGATFVRDVMFALPGGAVICRMAPHMRHGEEQFVQKTLSRLNVPIVGSIIGKGVFEGGSFGFLSPGVAFAGHSKRGNREALRQIEQITDALGIELITIPLVGHAIHTDGAFSVVDVDKALCIPDRLPWEFLETLEDRGIQLIEIDPEERWAVNSLTVRPGRLIVPAETVKAHQRMKDAGLEIIPIDYQEVQRNGGGIHCSTNPLTRQSVA